MPLTEERKTELKNMLQDMEELANGYYWKACKIGNHGFIEITGLMNEYIKICYRALANDMDFTLLSGHTGEPLPVLAHEVNYINEKLECVFVGHSFMVEKESP